MKYLIIDGYNAISKIKKFDVQKDISLESSRLSFIKALVDFRQRNRKFNKIIVVFDGKGDSLELARETYGDVEILFSSKDKDADKTIVPICEGCGLIAIHDEFKNKSYCPTCGDNTEINSVEIAYAFKLILDEFKSLGIYPRLELKNKYYHA